MCPLVISKGVQNVRKRNSPSESQFAACLLSAETLPEEVLEKMHAPPKPDIPIIDPKKLTEADGEPSCFGTLLLDLLIQAVQAVQRNFHKFVHFLTQELRKSYCS